MRELGRELFRITYILLLLVLINPLDAFSVQREDSLLNVIKAAPRDTSRVNLVIRYGLDILNNFYEEGYELGKETLILSENLGYQKGIAYSNELIAIYFWYNGIYDKAAAYFKQTVQEAAKTHDYHLMAEATNRWGLVHYYQAEHDSARSYHQKALNYFRKAGDSLGVARIWTHIGLTYYHEAKYRQAVDYYLRALDLYESEDAPLSISSTIKKLSKVYMELGQLDLLHHYQQEILEMYQQEVNSYDKPQFLEDLGDVYHNSGNLDSAMVYYKRAANDFKKGNYIHNYDFMIYKIGCIHREKNDFQKTLKCFKICLEIRLTSGTRIHLGSIKSEIAILYAEMEDWDHSITFYKEAIELHHQMGNSITLASNYAGLANAYFMDGNQNQALNAAQKGLTIAKEIDSKESILSNLKILKDIYIGLDQPLQAFQYQKEYYELEADVRQNETLKEISELQFQYNQIRNEKEIAELKQREIQFNSEIQERNLLVIIFIILSLSIIGGTLLLYNRYKLKVKNNELLIQRNRKIEAYNKLLNKKNKEGELLLAEIRHRIKNNLQTISSILSMQSRQVSKKQKTFMQESYDRVQAMMLIHQKLHKDTQYSSVALDSYMEDVINNLLLSYGRNQDVRLNLSIPSVSLEADSAVYLGLVINEIVSNALKHAFENISQPTISLKIIQLKDNKLRVEVHDNGVGIDQRKRRPDSFGMKLTKILIQELEGELQLLNKNGTTLKFDIRCPIYQQNVEKDNAVLQDVFDEK